MTSIIAAILLGLAGSLHCVGMCGPIALALPIHQANYFKRIIGALSYNFGRATTYALLGAIIGLFGQGLNWIGLQQIVSILLGICILLYYIIPDFFSRSKINQLFTKQIYRLKNALIPFLKKRNVSALFIVGTLNGLLPCGLVYTALVAAIALSGIQQSMSFMFFFGMGTLPFMLSIIVLKNWITIKFQSRINKFLPSLMIIMAVLLIFRGLNLGIPYVSPKINKDEKVSCHYLTVDSTKAHACIQPNDNKLVTRNTKQSNKKQSNNVLAKIK